MPSITNQLLIKAAMLLGSVGAAHFDPQLARMNYGNGNGKLGKGGRHSKPGKLYGHYSRSKYKPRIDTPKAERYNVNA